MVEGPVILRFGMMEGTAKVKGDRVVYDPQSALDPRPFKENGSSAARLAFLVNGYELEKMTGTQDYTIGAELLLREGADIVVVKRGSLGCLVVMADGTAHVPAYKSDFVWGIGSGDVFAAAFAHFWAEKGISPDKAADLSSRATALYCGSMSLSLPSQNDLQSSHLHPIGSLTGRRRVYLAGPFFNLTQRWLVEEARNHLLAQGMDVFSPLHDIGSGPAETVVSADLEGLHGCDRVLALVDGGDVGTIFEIGYARAKHIPVVAFAQNTSEGDLKMLSGSGCIIVNDFVTAIYHTSWIEGAGT
ncbi:MAG: PfkB family carbohydrate kinase [Dehalococcoidia bacterium]|nr:PfkB family carbohydrate kinase [Dehalococcoidia bacterium]